MPQVNIKITPEFSAAMKELQQKIKQVDALTARVNRLAQRSNIIVFPQQRTQQIQQLPGAFRRFQQVLRKFDSMVQTSVERFNREIGSLARLIVKGFNVESFVTMPVFRVLGFLTFGVAPWALATSLGAFRWLWNKVMALGEAMIKDRQLALQAGTTVSGIRAFRTAFSMLPEDPRLISIIGQTRAYDYSRVSSVVHWLLGVKKNQDTMDTIVQTLLAAQQFMKAQPRHLALQRAQLMHLTDTISPDILMMLLDMSAEEVTTAARKFEKERKRMSQSEAAQKALVDFVIAVKTMWINIETSLGKKLVEYGITDSLKKIMEATTDLIEFGLHLPVTQHMIKGLEEDIKWFGEWLGDTKNQKTLGKLVQGMIVNFEKGVAILVEVSGDAQKAAGIRREVIRLEARQARRERGMIGRPGVVSGRGNVIGFPLTPQRIHDLPPTSQRQNLPVTQLRGAPSAAAGAPSVTAGAPSATAAAPSATPGKRPDPTTTRPSTPRTRAPSAVRPQPGPRRPGPIPEPSRPPTPSPPQVPAPPPQPTPPPVVPGPQPGYDTPAPTPQTPSTKIPLGPFNRPRQRPGVWTRHPSAASQPSDRPLPSRTPPITDDDRIRPRVPWTRHPSQAPEAPAVTGQPGRVSPGIVMPGTRQPPQAPGVWPARDPRIWTRHPAPIQPTVTEAPSGPAFPRGDVTRRPLGEVPQPPVTTAGVPGIRGGPSGRAVPPTVLSGRPLETAGIRGLPGGPAGDPRYGVPRAPQFPAQLDAGRIPRPFVSAKPYDQAVTGPAGRTPSGVIMPGAPMEPMERPWGGDIAVRPPVQTAGRQGPIGTPSGPAVGKLRPPQLPAQIDYDKLTLPRGPAIWTRHPQPTAAAPAPAPAPAPVPFPGPGRPTAPAPAPTTPAAPTPAPTPQTTAEPPMHEAERPGAQEIQNWNRYLSRLSYLESDHTGKATGSNKGFFQESDDQITRFKNLGVENAKDIQGTDYVKAKTRMREGITARNPDAAKAIEAGDWSKADDILGHQFGSLPTTYQTKNNKQTKEKYDNANKILEGKATGNMRAPDERGADSATPATTSTTPAAMKAPNGQNPKAFIWHYTEGRPGLDSVVSGWKERGPRIGAPHLGAQYFMDRDGNVHDVKKETGYDAHSQITSIREPFKSQGYSNDTVVGLEISAKDEDDITDTQFENAKKFYAENFPNTPVGAHGEVSGNRSEQPDEGATLTAILRAQKAGVDLKRDDVRQLVSELKALRTKKDYPSAAVDKAWDDFYKRAGIDKSKIDQNLPSTSSNPQGKTGTNPDQWGKQPEIPNQLDMKLDDKGRQIVQQPWSHLKGSNVPGEPPAKEIIPGADIKRRIPDHQDFTRDNNGKQIDPSVLKESERLASDPTKTVSERNQDVYKFITDQGYHVDPGLFCGDFVASVAKKANATGIPKDYATASAWVRAGDPVPLKKDGTPDIQPGDIAITRSRRHGGGATLSHIGESGSHVGMVGSLGVTDAKKNTFQFFSANTTGEWNNKDINQYIFRRLRYPQKLPYGDFDKPKAIPYLEKQFPWENTPKFDPNANPLDNLQVANNSDKRVSWAVPPGSNVRDIPYPPAEEKPTSQIPDPQKPKSEKPDPNKPDPKEPDKDKDKPKKTEEEPNKPKSVPDADKPAPKEDKKDPSSEDSGRAPTAEDHNPDTDS